MAQRKCEKCGSTDFVREDGFYVCQYCGAKYPAQDVPDTTYSEAESDTGRDTPPVRTPINVQINMSKDTGKNKKGSKTTRYVVMDARSPKSWGLTLVLAIFFGYFGLHRFYVGKLGTGAIWFCTAGCFFVGWLGDIWKIAIGQFTDGDGLYIRRK